MLRFPTSKNKTNKKSLWLVRLSATKMASAMVDEFGSNGFLPHDTFGDPTRQDIYACIEDLSQNMTKQVAKASEIFAIVDQIARTGNENNLLREASYKRKGETPLHTAIKLLQFKSEAEKKVVIVLLQNFPKFMLQDRKNTEYSGQAPLHMAVAKGNIWLVHTLLQYMSNPEQRETKSSLLKRRATGGIFTNTVMMAEIPLSIAALTFNKGMVDLLIQHGAELDGVNSQGDNVCHSLIRYSYLYPDSSNEVLEMCQHISKDLDPYDTSSRAIHIRKLRNKVWVMENGSGQNPLQLAAMLGQHAIFTFIMSQQAYCFENFNDGLFDIKIYDITDIDSISTMTKEELAGDRVEETRPKIPNEDVETLNPTKTKHVFKRSTLQMLLELDPNTAFQFILFPPLRRIIDQKWNRYRKYFYPWWLLHTAFMCCLTYYAVVRSHQNFPISSTNDVNVPPRFTNKIFANAFVTIYGIIGAGVSGVYISQEVVRFLKGKMPWTVNTFVNPYSNGAFRVMFVAFGLSLIVDFFTSVFAEYYELYCLYVSLVLGWFLLLFFLRALRPFSFITVLIQNVLIGDVFRFFVVISIELVAFTTCMYMAMQAAAADDSTFNNFGEVMLTLFQLMFGLGEVSALLSARKPFITVAIFVLFIMFTTILMVNALIAIMSFTCTEVIKRTGNISARDMHWRLQRLSSVLFFESVLPDMLVFHVGEEKKVLRYNNSVNQRKLMIRYMMEVRSLQNEPADIDEEEKPYFGLGFQTAVFKVIENRIRRTSLFQKTQRPTSPNETEGGEIIPMETRETQTDRPKSPPPPISPPTSPPKSPTLPPPKSPTLSPPKSPTSSQPRSPPPVREPTPSVLSLDPSTPLPAIAQPFRLPTQRTIVEIYHITKACGCPDDECIHYE